MSGPTGDFLTLQDLAENVEHLAVEIVEHQSEPVCGVAGKLAIEGTGEYFAVIPQTVFTLEGFWQSYGWPTKDSAPTTVLVAQ